MNYTIEFRPSARKASGLRVDDAQRIITVTIVAHRRESYRGL